MGSDFDGQTGYLVAVFGVPGKRDSWRDRILRARSKRRVHLFSGGIIVPQSPPQKRASQHSTLDRQLELLRIAASQQKGESGPSEKGK